MKATIQDSEYGLNIILEPETKDEVLQMLRYSSNAKKEKPSVFFVFSKEPYLNIWLKKKAISVQSNSISSY